MIDLRPMTKEQLLVLEQDVQAEIQARYAELTIDRVDFFLRFNINLVSEFLASKGFKDGMPDSVEPHTWCFTVDKTLSEKKLKKLMKEVNRLECLEGGFE